MKRRKVKHGNSIPGPNDNYGCLDLGNGILVYPTFYKSELIVILQKNNVLMKLHEYIFDVDLLLIQKHLDHLGQCFSDNWCFLSGCTQNKCRAWGSSVSHRTIDIE